MDELTADDLAAMLLAEHLWEIKQFMWRMASARKGPPTLPFLETSDLHTAAVLGYVVRRLVSGDPDGSPTKVALAEAQREFVGVLEQQVKRLRDGLDGRHQ
jgi:hypothetical protein